jgi:hypothetical protein
MQTNKMRSIALLAATTLVVAACGNSNDRDVTPPGAMVNQPPTLSVIADQTSDQDTTVGPIEFTIGDPESAATDLSVDVVADNASVFPADGLVLSGTGATRSITLTPLEAATGATMIGMRVTDAENATVTRAFKVTVNAKNASLRDIALNTFAKGATDDPTTLNGFTFAQDADDPMTFEALIPPDAP